MNDKLSDLLTALLSGLADFLSSDAGKSMVAFAIIVAVVGFVFSLPVRVYRKNL